MMEEWTQLIMQVQFGIADGVQIKMILCQKVYSVHDYD